MLESYVTPLITSYLSKYIKNIKPSDLQLSFWGGDVVLYNLELRPEAIEESLKDLVPFNLKSGCVKKLTMHIPWTAIGSEAITLSLESVECSVKLKNLKMSESTAAKPSESAPPSTTTIQPDDQSQQTPGYVQGLTNRIISNIKVDVQNMVVKVIEEESDMEMSFTVKSLQWYTTNSNWEAEYVYTDSSQGVYSICKRCIISNMTICLDQIGSGGQVEVYEEPFVPRCSLECRWMSRYEDGSLVENLIDVLSEELKFSVTEAQFSLFLHLLDWLLAMYYSYKKLKGRDDLENVGTEGEGARTLEEEEGNKPQVHVGSEANTPSPALSPVAESTEDMGWGAWMWSFVTPDGDELGTVKSVKQVSQPGLSLNLAVKNVTVDLKINQRRRNPVFFSSLKRISTQVMRMELLGCLAHISRVPSTTLLGVSAGIMSVNGWVGGTCPCRLKLKENQRHHHHDNFEETLMHIYSLGTPRSSTCITGVVSGTFFESLEGTSVDATSGEGLSPKDWLQWKQQYQAAWFSYEYYDKKEPERREEECQEKVRIGEQNIVVSPDVVHRVWFFVNGFLKSLEAVPLVSQGMIVIGDPQARTNLELLSSTARILITANCHAVSSKSSFMKQTPGPRNPTSFSNLAIYYDQLNIDIAMPMYSGNATPLNNQESLMNINCKGLQVSSCDWSFLGAGVSSLVDGVSGSGNSNLGLGVPDILVNTHSKSNGTVEDYESYISIQANSVQLNVDYNELTAYFVLYQTWAQDAVDQTSPLECSSLFSSPLMDRRRSDMFSLQMYDCYFESKKCFASSAYSCSSSCMKISMVLSNGSHVPSALPIACCPANTRQFVLSPQSHLHFDLLDKSGGVGTNKALELYLAREENESRGLSAKVKVSGGLFLIEHSLLDLVNTTLDGLVQLSFMLTPRDAEIPPMEGMTFSANRPEPEGVSSAELYTPTVVTSQMATNVSLLVPQDKVDGEEEEIDKEGEEEMTKGNVQLEGLLSLINETRFNIEMDHFMIVSTCSQSVDYLTLFKGYVPQTTNAVLRTLVDNGQLIFLILPALTVHTTDSHVYPLYTTKLPGTSSWQASLTDGVLYSVATAGSVPQYLMHPFSVEVSLAPVRSSLAVGGVSGYGIHLDVDLIHVSLSRELLLTTRKTLSALMASLSPLYNKPDIVLEKTVPHALETVKPPSRPSSALSSSHLSIVQQSIYQPPSESSISGFSSNGTRPSLWLQCTLSKLVLELASDKLKDKVIGSKLVVDLDDNKQGPRECSQAIYKYESEELSFSLDKQEKGLNCQVKVSSLEGYQCLQADQRAAIQIGNDMFEKLFSSKCAVLSEQVSQRVEFVSGSLGPMQSPAWESRTSGTTGNLTSHGSFLVLDIKDHFQPHQAMQVKLQVQMFEVVVSAPLVKRAMDILEGISGSSQKNDSPTTEVAAGIWPHLDLKLDCFRVLFPTTSSSMSSSTGLIFDVGGALVRSDFNYPVSRMEVNASALRRLSIMAAEKRIPPLPGYEVQVFAVHLLGLNLETKDGDSTQIASNYNPVSVFPILATAGIEIQLSPALQWPPYCTTHTDKIYASGNSLEISFKSDIVVSLGISQVSCALKIFLDFKHCLESAEPNLSNSGSTPLQTSTMPPVPPNHLLITAKSVHVEYCQASSLKDKIHVTAFDPVLVMTRTLSSVLVKCSVFNVESKYSAVDLTKDHTPLLESVATSCDTVDSTHLSNVVSVEVEQSLDKERCSVNVLFDRSLKLSLSPELFALLDRILSDISFTLHPILIASQSPHPSHITEHSPLATDTFTFDQDSNHSQHSLLTALKINVKTRQFVLQLNSALSATSQPSCKETRDSSFNHVIISFNELWLILPAMESLTDQGYHCYGNEEFDALKSVIHCNGLCIKLVNRVTTGHMTDFLLFPANFRCTIVHHVQLGFKYHSDRTVLTVLSDPIKISGGLKTLETINTVSTLYSQATETFINTLKRFIENCAVQHEDTMKENHLVTENKTALFKDDLRQGYLSFNTEDVHSQLFPIPGEVRFFTGDVQFPPHMIWQYREPRCVTRVHVLPVPLGILSHEDPPTDLTVHCQLAYFDELDRVFVVVGSLYLSETSPASWNLREDSDTLEAEKGEEFEKGPQEIHACVWRLTLIGLEWTEEEEEEEFINRTDFPLVDVSACSVLSPLVLAGCTTVDSIISPDQLPYLSFGVTMKKTNVLLLNQPTVDTAVVAAAARYYKEYSVSNDLSQEQFTLLELEVGGLSMQWTLHRNSRKVGKVKATFGLLVQDLRDLTLREVLHPTSASLNLVLEKATSLSLFLEPCLIRVSPALVHTVTMGARLISTEAEHASSPQPSSTSSSASTLSPLPIFATYIICNKTTTDLYIGQDSTIQCSTLLRGSCIGYHWYTQCTDQQRLRLSVMAETYSNSWTWSSPFSVDQEGTQEICITSVGRQSIFFYAEVSCLSGIQKQVIISGLWTVSSNLPFPLAVFATQNDLVSTPYSENVEGTMLNMLDPNKELSLTPPVDTVGVLRVAAACSQTTSYDWFDVALNDQKKSLQPFSLKVLSPDGSVTTTHSWCNVLPRFVGEQFQRTPINAIFSPFFMFINNLPQDLELIAEANDTTNANTKTVLTLCGRGSHTPVFNLQHNSWYLVRLSLVSSSKGVASPPFPLSTCIINQLPCHDDVNCGEWPYYKCCSHRPTDNAKSRNVSIKTVSLPIGQNGESIPVHIELTRKKVGGTVLVIISPDMLLVNETSQVFSMGVGVAYGRKLELAVEGTVKATAAIRRDEEFRLSVEINGNCLHSLPFSVRTPNLKDKKWKYKRISLSNDEVATETVIEFSLHKNTLLATLKPSHIMINRTSHKLFVLPALCRSSSDTVHKNGYILSLEPSSSAAVTAWQSKTVEGGERVAHYSLAITGCTDREEWSLPLLMNFVRRSFCLPVRAGGTSSSLTAVSCLLTTHELDSISYIVINNDPSPRLLVKNQAHCCLEIREANMHWLHSHSQTLYPHSYVSYDPPSLAMQYPLIKEWVESEDEVRNMNFIQLNDIKFQFKVHENHEALWSDGVKLPLGKGDEVGVAIPGYGTVNVLMTRKGRVFEISIVPALEKESITTCPGIQMVKDASSHSSTLSIEIISSQLVLALNRESPTTIQPVLILTCDNTHIKVQHAPFLSRASLEMEALQIDSYFDSVPTVVLCPRVLHDPPVRLVKPRLPPFITTSVEIVGSAHERIVESFIVSLEPVTFHLDDTLIIKLGKVLQNYGPPLSMVAGSRSNTLVQSEPLEVLAEAERDNYPVQLQQLSISQVSVFLTAHVSMVISISCDDSPLCFSPILLADTFTNLSDLSQSLAIHYITGLVMQGGWVLGSLDLLGSPSVLINTLQTGLYNLFSLPYEGLTRSPGFFVLGLGQGVSSLVGNVSGGVLRAVTNFAKSVATNMEHFSLDPDHSSYQMSLRRGQRSSNLGSSLLSGVSSFGMSLMSAVAGIVDQPMQMIHHSQSQDISGYTQGMLAGVGKGILGLVTKPIGGAFQLVSQTGQGILNTSGLICKPNIKNSLLLKYCQTTNRNTLMSSVDKYHRLLQAKHLSDQKTVGTTQEGLLCLSARGGICLPAGSVYDCLVLLTEDKVHVFDTKADLLLASFKIFEYNCLEGEKMKNISKKKNAEGATPDSRLFPQVHQIQLERGTHLHTAHTTPKRDPRRRRRVMTPTTECTLKEHRDENPDNTMATEASADPLPPLGGTVVVLVPMKDHEYSDTKGAYKGANPHVQRYLKMSTEPPLDPSEFDRTTSSRDKYTLTFEDEIGGLFRTLFSHNKEIISTSKF